MYLHISVNDTVDFLFIVWAMSAYLNLFADSTLDVTIKKVNITGVIQLEFVGVRTTTLVPCLDRVSSCTRLNYRL